MRKRTKTILILSVLGMFLSIGLLAGSWYYLDALSVRLSEGKQEIANTLAHVDAEREMVRFVKASAEERAALEQLILPSDDGAVIEFLSYIESLGVREGVTVETRELKELDKENTFGEISLALQIEGGFLETTRFIALLETLPYRSYIESMKILEGNTPSSGWQASLELRITTYQSA